MRDIRSLTAEDNDDEDEVKEENGDIGRGGRVAPRQFRIQRSLRSYRARIPTRSRRRIQRGPGVSVRASERTHACVWKLFFPWPSSARAVIDEKVTRRASAR